MCTFTDIDLCVLFMELMWLYLRKVINMHYESLSFFLFDPQSKIALCFGPLCDFV